MTHADYSSRTYLPELDGLRASSIVIVISVHLKDKVWGWLAGDLGVTVFFVLSGYLITMLALREERSRGALNLPAFFVRRAFRLFPLYYLVLGLYCLLIFGLNWSPEKRGMLAGALPYYLAYFQEYPFLVGVDGQYNNLPFYQSWSLGIEEKFYLVWPFLGFVAWRGSKTTRQVGTAVLALLMMASPILVGPLAGRFLTPYSHILIGCLVALLLDDPAWFARLAWLGRPLALWGALVAFLALHFGHPWMADDWEQIGHLGYSAATAVFLVALLLGEGVIQRALRIPLLVKIGRLSYGMYLIHLLALNVADKVVKPGSGKLSHAIASYVLACVVAATGAYLLSIVVEQPFIAIGKRLSAGLKGKDARKVEAAQSVA